LLVIQHQTPIIHVETAAITGTFGREPARPSSTTTVPAAEEGDGELCVVVTMDGRFFLVAP
jgi:hypothetical protein